MLLIGSVSHTPCLVRKALVVNLPCVSLAMRCFLRLGLETQSPKSSPRCLASRGRCNLDGRCDETCRKHPSIKATTLSLPRRLGAARHCHYFANKMDTKATTSPRPLESPHPSLVIARSSTPRCAVASSLTRCPGGAAAGGTDLLPSAFL